MRFLLNVLLLAIAEMVTLVLLFFILGAHAFSNDYAITITSGATFRRRQGNERRSTTTTTSVSSYLDNLSTGSSSQTQSPVPTEPTTTQSQSLSKPHQTLRSVPVLSLAHADAIASNVVDCCLRNQFNPIVVHVMDPSGIVITTKRMDGCSAVGAADFAYAKAYACLVNNDSSRAFREKYTADTFDQTQPGKFGQMLAMVDLSGGKMAPFPGGILLKYYDGHVVGAVGVSGAAGDEDEYCALRGVVESEISGLVTVPESHSCATVNEPAN